MQDNSKRYDAYFKDMYALFNKAKNEEELKELVKDFPELKKEEYLKAYKIYKYSKEGDLLYLYRFANHPNTLHITNFKNMFDVLFQVRIAKLNDRKINKVLIDIENKTYPDIDLLEELDEEVYLRNDDIGMSIDDFKNMRASIDYYKSLVDDDMSPLEKCTFIYDVVKSFSYHENEEYGLDSRKIAFFLKSGDIVCTGYTSLFNQILQEIGFQTYRVSISVNDRKHACSLINIDDDKYNIHGPFIFDATVDSAKNLCKCIINGKEEIKYSENLNENDKVIKKYDNTILYNHFLLPLGAFLKKYSGCHITKITDYTKKEVGNEDFYKKIEMVNLNEYEFPLSIKSFILLLYRVKIAEGFNKDSIREYICDVLEVNDYDNVDLETIKRIIDEEENSKKNSI